MSGHSKWATIKRKKGANDAARGRLFGKLIKAIEAAARDGGADPDMNPTLATMVQKAKDASVPKDNIERALKRGAGELDEGVAYDDGRYEGYAPGGIAVMVDFLTDNRNRTASDIRNLFDKSGGSLAEPGAVAYMFTRRGQVVLDGVGHDEEELMLAGLDHGLEQIEEQGEVTICWCDPADFADLREALKESSFEVKRSGSAMVPSTTIPVAEESQAKKVLRLVDSLEDNDDVQDVWLNADIDEQLLETIDLD